MFKVTITTETDVTTRTWTERADSEKQIEEIKARVNKDMPTGATRTFSVTRSGN